MSKLNRKYITIMIAVAAILYLPIKEGLAAAIQKGRQVASFEMFMPADTTIHTVNSSNKPISSRPINHNKNKAIEDDGIIGSATVNYNIEMAKAWFPPVQEDAIIEVDSFPKRILVTEGRNLLIKLVEEENQIWSCDHEDELRLISRTNENGELLLVFNAVESGTTMLYLDLIDRTGGVYKVIESRKIYVIVG